MLNNIVTHKPRAQNFWPFSECLIMFSSLLNEELIEGRERAGGIFNTMGCFCRRANCFSLLEPHNTLTHFVFRSFLLLMQGYGPRYGIFCSFIDV